MKFETPIAEVELFELKDIISASGENPEEPSDTTLKDSSYADSAFPGECYYDDKRDNENWNDCL